MIFVVFFLRLFFQLHSFFFDYFILIAIQFIDIHLRSVLCWSSAVVHAENLSKLILYTTGWFPMNNQKKTYPTTLITYQ